MVEQKQAKKTYGMNWVKTQLMQDIENILDKHQKIPFLNLKFILVRKYGVADKMIFEVLNLYSQMGIIKYDEKTVELVKNDVLREEHKPEPEGDRAQPGDEHTSDAERQV